MSQITNTFEIIFDSVPISNTIYYAINVRIIYYQSYDADDLKCPKKMQKQS